VPTEAPEAPETPEPPADLIAAREQAESLFATTRRRGLAYADPVYRHLHPQLMRLKDELFRLCEACEDTVDYDRVVALLHRLLAVLRWRDL
jgi:RNA polymerase-binding transcription factor DksA